MSTLNIAAAIRAVVGSAVRVEARVLVLCEYKTLAAKEEVALTAQAYVAQNEGNIWFRDCRTGILHGMPCKNNHKPFVKHRAGRQTCIAWRHPLCLISLGKIKTRWEHDKVDQ